MRRLLAFLLACFWLFVLFTTVNAQMNMLQARNNAIVHDTHMHELQYPAYAVQVLANVRPVRLTYKPEEKVGFLVRKGHWTSLVVAAKADRVQMHYDPQVGTSLCHASCMPLTAAVTLGYLH